MLSIWRALVRRIGRAKENVIRETDIATRHVPKRIGSALFGITRVVFLGDAAGCDVQPVDFAILVRRLCGVPLRLDAVRHPALRQD